MHERPIGPSGLLPMLMVFGVFPSQSISTIDYPMQRERMLALRTLREEVSALTTSWRIAQALPLRLPHAARYSIHHGDQVRTYREERRSSAWMFTVSHTIGNQVSVSDRKGVTKRFSVYQRLPVPTGREDLELIKTAQGVSPYLAPGDA